VCAAISYPVVTLERRVMEDVCLGLVVLVFGAERIAGDAFDFGFAEGLVVVLAPDIDRDIWAAEACGEAVISDGTEGAAAFAGLARVTAISSKTQKASKRNYPPCRQYSAETSDAAARKNREA